jgi:membrane-associated phospholipid phosphatase
MHFEIKSSCNLFLKLIILLYVVINLNLTAYSYDSTKTQKISLWQVMGNDVTTSLKDAGSYVTFPLHMTVEEWFFAAGILDALVVISTTDAVIKEKVSTTTRNDYNHNFWDIPTAYGEPIVEGVFSSGVYFTGLFTHNNSIRVTGRLLLETLALAGAMDLLSKYLTGRDRPYFNNDQYRFKAFQTKGEHVSFPSGHTTTAFAVSTVLSERIDNLYARIGLYSLAALTACARVRNNVHWFSDVVAGSLLGFGTGYFMVHREDNRDKKSGGFSFYPSLNGLNATWRW